MKHLVLASLLASLACASAVRAADEDPLQAAREAADKGDTETALKILKDEAEKGNGEAANAVAEAILNGRAGKASPTEAVKWFEKAVAAGDPAGQTNLALLLLTAPAGVEKDAERARFLVTQASEKDYAPAQLELARLLESEIDLDGPTPDWSEPRDLLEKAAAKGNPGALFTMVRYLDEGLGGPPEPDKATDFCIAAARAGSLEAMNEMGLRYQAGKGIRTDNVAAVGWFTVAAQLGFAPAQVNLGQCYSKGEGLRQDYNKAGEHFAAAAKAHYAPGEFLLGQLFEGGLGTRADAVSAFVLYSRAVAHGLAEAEARRDEIGGKLDPAQKAEAARLLAAEQPPHTEER